MSRSLKAHILLVLVTLVWGATFVVIKNALADVTPLLFNAVRMSFAACLLAAVYWRYLRAMSRATLRAGVVVGVFLWLGYEFQTTGLKLTTPSKSAFLTGVSVVLVPVFLALLWRRKVNRWSVFGVALAFVGLFLLTVPTARAGEFLDLASINRGDVLSFICAVAFAFQIIFLGRATRVHRFEPIAVLQIATAAVLMWATIPAVEHAAVVWSARVVIAILVTGVLGTAAAFTIQAWAQQFTPPTHTALIFALEPVFAWITSYLFLHERLGGRAGAGAVLIIAGVLLSELKGSVAAPAQELTVEVGPAQAE